MSENGYVDEVFETRETNRSTSARLDLIANIYQDEDGEVVYDKNELKIQESPDPNDILPKMNKLSSNPNDNTLQPKDSTYTGYSFYKGHDQFNYKPGKVTAQQAAMNKMIQDGVVEVDFGESPDKDSEHLGPASVADDPAYYKKQLPQAQRKKTVFSYLNSDPAFVYDGNGRKILETKEHARSKNPVTKRYIMTIPAEARSGVTIQNIGGQKNRTLKIPKGVSPGEDIVLLSIT